MKAKTVIVFGKDLGVIHCVDAPEFSLDIIRDINAEKYGFSLICKNDVPPFTCRYGFLSAREAWFGAFAWLEDYLGIDSDEFPLPFKFR